MKLKLRKLFLDHNIKDISFNSRGVKSGTAFFAIRGENFDGNDFIQEALSKGANIVFSDNPENANGEKIFFLENVREGLAIAASIIYPDVPENLIAVTGTNGKSSVVSYVYQILSALGRPSACMGTLGIESNVVILDELESIGNIGLTTRDPINFRKSLNSFFKSGIKNVAFEASSHGLQQRRIGDIKAKTAAFTSFSQDHLEYHKTMDDYLNAKLILFTENLDKNAEVVINSEMMFVELIKKFLEKNNIAYSKVGLNGDLKITSNIRTIQDQEINFSFLNKDYKIRTNIIGSFQATNLLIAAKLVYNLGENFDDIAYTLPKIQGVCGRLQRITNSESNWHVFVDYAHTPDALEKSLKELKELKKNSGKLYLIFGCGGDRDTSKRPIMGKIATKIADRVVITDDNPRTENPAKIRNEIFAGANGADIIADRKDAITYVINSLKNYDILLIAGKGHEDYQIIGQEIIKFSDIEVAKNSIKNRIM